MPGVEPDTQNHAPACDRPTVAAVVINYNGGDKVLNTVQALKDQQEPLTQIIVCDNASTDGSPDQLRERFPEITVHDMPGNDGLPIARNTGLRLANTDLVFLVDADVYAQVDTLTRMVDTYVSFDRPAVVCPRIRLIPETEIVQAEGATCHFLGTMTLRHAYTPADQLPDTAEEVGGCIGASYLLDRKRVLEAGGYDETYFFYNEDLEFAVRLRAFGERFICEPNAVVMHDRGQGYAGLSFRGKEAKYPARRAYLSMRHRLLMVFSHYRLWTLIVLSPALLVYELASLAAAVLKGFTWQWFRAWGWNLANLKLILEKRRSIQPRRQRSDKDVYVGGAIPLAPGFVSNRIAAAGVWLLSGAFNLYWTLARWIIA